MFAVWTAMTSVSQTGARAHFYAGNPLYHSSCRTNSPGKQMSGPFCAMMFPAATVFPRSESAPSEGTVLIRQITDTAVCTAVSVLTFYPVL